ncbi:MAG TPA: hypothetical protein VMU50_12970 [Polyangia bacterium]|nr:hypothetical protein [Polyangia bacterium]
MTSPRTAFSRGGPRALGVLSASVVLLSGAVSLAQTSASAPTGPVPTPAAGATSTTTTTTTTTTSAPPSSGAPPAATTAAPAPAAGSGAGDSGGYTVRLRSLERNVNELKEQIFRTKARLNLLKETVLGGVIGASRAIIKHKNEMGSSFRLIKAVYALDGVQIFAKTDDTGRLSEMQEFDVYNGAIQPGSHTLSVMMQYQGNGFGVFSYLKGFKFTVHSSQTFVAGESKTTAISVVGYEKGNITTQLQDRPAIGFTVNVMSATEGGATAAVKK